LKGALVGLEDQGLAGVALLDPGDGGIDGTGVEPN